MTYPSPSITALQAANSQTTIMSALPRLLEVSAAKMDSLSFDIVRLSNLSGFLAGLLIVSLAVYTFTTYDKRRRQLPPKIPSWPVVNHTFLQQSDNMPPVLRAWGEKYGEVFRTKAGTTTFIWLNSKEAVKELFDRRSAIYSSRQPMPMAFDCAT